MEHESRAGDRFPATRLSVIDAARSSDPMEQARALETLFAAYWKPVYKYIRLRWNRSADDAQDFTQGFFTELLERDLLAKYDPAKSRLRTYLRVCVDSSVIEFPPSARLAFRKWRRQRGSIDCANVRSADLEVAYGEAVG